MQGELSVLCSVFKANWINTSHSDRNEEVL